MNRRAFFASPLALAAIIKGPKPRLLEVTRTEHRMFSDVYRLGASWGGPVAGAAMAALAATATAINVSAIRDARW